MGATLLHPLVLVHDTPLSPDMSEASAVLHVDLYCRKSRDQQGIGLVQDNLESMATQPSEENMHLWMTVGEVLSPFEMALLNEDVPYGALRYNKVNVSCLFIC